MKIKGDIRDTVNEDRKKLLEEIGEEFSDYITNLSWNYHAKKQHIKNASYDKELFED